MLFEPYVPFLYLYLSLGNRVAACWETAAHSDYECFLSTGA